jgi:hypothetical protein
MNVAAWCLEETVLRRSERREQIEGRHAVASLASLRSIVPDLLPGEAARVITAFAQES